MLVKDLRSGSGFDKLEGEIVSISEARSFAGQKGSGKVANAALKDKTGEIKVSLWNEQIDMVKEGDKVKIENGWCSEWQGQKQVSTGKLGSLTVVE